VSAKADNGDAHRQHPPIGVFDSGIGGLSVLRALRGQLPRENFVYYADSAFAPYGEQSDSYVQERSLAVAEHLLLGLGVKALVIACNTATAASIDALRRIHPLVPIIGIEPALKPASALTRTGFVGVMATHGTLSSARFQALLTSQKGAAHFVCQPCDGLAEAIEHAGSSGDATNLIAHYTRCTGAMGRFGSEAGAIDTLVLGCTHYPLAAGPLGRHLGDEVRLVEPGHAVARHTANVLAQRKLLRTAPENVAGSLEFIGSGPAEHLQRSASFWLSLSTSAPAIAGQSFEG